ncbi:hypothetical protein T05_81 [Trichinella murrelli]|uniref:Uncharacterized protein n=1 Tax=Trichinella murrelli TaxID=144512 RepID=A0A0V0U2M7_9BILA|nr:hypothetical protein T05_81 [Trichinella murrelli]
MHSIEKKSETKLNSFQCGAAIAAAAAAAAAATAATAVRYKTFVGELLPKSSMQSMNIIILEHNYLQITIYDIVEIGGTKVKSVIDLSSWIRFVSEWWHSIMKSEFYLFSLQNDEKFWQQQQLDTHRRFEVKRKKKRSVLCCVFGWCLLRTQNGQLKHACLLVQHLLICDKSNLSSSAE